VANVAAMVLMAGVNPAAGSVTVGQVAPGVPTSCSNSFDFLQHSTPDNSYAMPATGVITSWVAVGRALFTKEGGLTLEFDETPPA
jgi:hypothetical protein